MRASCFRENGFPTRRVRASLHDEALVLPEFPEIHDPNQKKPLRDVVDYFDDIFLVNAHLNPDRRFGLVTMSELHIATTAVYGINVIRRVQSQADRNLTYQLGAAVKSARNANHVVMEIDHLPQIRGSLVFEGKELFNGPMSEDASARDSIQFFMKRVLDDLGYGEPEEFSSGALDLDKFKAAQDPPIVCPAPYVPGTVMGALHERRYDNPRFTGDAAG